MLLMCPDDMLHYGFHSGQRVSLVLDADDNVARRLDGLIATPFDLPRGCLGAYYPEANPLVPLRYHDRQSKTPAAKGVPARIETTISSVAETL